MDKPTVYEKKTFLQQVGLHLWKTVCNIQFNIQSYISDFCDYFYFVFSTVPLNDVCFYELYETF